MCVFVCLRILRQRHTSAIIDDTSRALETRHHRGEAFPWRYDGTNLCHFVSRGLAREHRNCQGDAVSLASSQLSAGDKGSVCVSGKFMSCTGTLDAILLREIVKAKEASHAHQINPRAVVLASRRTPRECRDVIILAGETKRGE